MTQKESGRTIRDIIEQLVPEHPDGRYMIDEIMLDQAEAELKAFIKKDIECYSCGEKIKYDEDRPECYCNSCLPMGKALMDEEELRKVIDSTLSNYRCQHTKDENEDNQQLVDLLSPFKTIKEGKEELEYISDDLLFAIKQWWEGK